MNSTGHVNSPNNSSIQTCQCSAGVGGVIAWNDAPDTGSAQLKLSAEVFAQLGFLLCR
jgi:hypothetical protein